MSLTLIIVIIAFLLLTSFYWIGAFTVMYHLIRFGIGTLPKKLALVFLLGSIFLFFMTSIACVMSYGTIERVVGIGINLSSHTHDI
jgi:hypothetical protein